jgi:hypothetical protein
VATGDLLGVRFRKHAINFDTAMHLKTKLRILEHVDHLSHKVTLALVAISLLALLLGYLDPDARKAESAVTELLHFVHWFALAVAVLYLLARLLLEKNVGRHLATLVKDAKAYDVPTTGTAREKSAPRSGSLEIAPTEIEFVTSSSSSLQKTLNDLNIRGFEGSIAFGMTEDEVTRRNSAIIDRCATAFLLVRAGTASPDVYVGYTCVLPLNDVGADVYLRGLIKDKDIPESLICREGETAGAILVFAIVLDERIARSKSLKGKSFGFLLRALEYHVATVAARYPSVSDRSDVWVQSEDESLRRLLLARGFRSSEPRRISADGHELLVLKFDRETPKDRQGKQTGSVNEPDVTEQAAEVALGSQTSPGVAAEPLAHGGGQKQPAS